MSGRQGPPEHVEERTPGHVHVGKTRDEQLKEEIDQLRDSVDWDNAPDWARLLHIQLEALLDE